MKAVLIRLKGGMRQPDAPQTLGRLTVYEDLREKMQTWMLEPGWRGNKTDISCIPDGTYWVKKWYADAAKKAGKRYQYDHFEVMDVPGRTAILWHGGNFRDDTKGCMLPGMALQDMDTDGLLDVVSSRAALNDLFRFLPDKFQLTIISI